MNKPTDYDNYRPYKAKEKIDAGAHRLVILKVEEPEEANGEYIVVYFDTDKNDSQPGFFTKQYKSDDRPDKQWPFTGRTRVYNKDYGYGNALTRFVKESVEPSNSGFIVKWGENFCAQFKGKKVGGVFRDHKKYINGKVATVRDFAWFVNVADVDGYPVPQMRDDTNKATTATSTASASPDDFMNIPNGVEDDELPFV